MLYHWYLQDYFHLLMSQVKCSTEQHYNDGVDDADDVDDVNDDDDNDVNDRR